MLFSAPSSLTFSDMAALATFQNHMFVNLYYITALDVALLALAHFVPGLEVVMSVLVLLLWLGAAAYAFYVYTEAYTIQSKQPGYNAMHTIFYFASSLLFMAIVICLTVSVLRHHRSSSGPSATLSFPDPIA